MLAERHARAGAIGVQLVLGIFGDPGPENDSVVEGADDLTHQLGQLVAGRIQYMIGVDPRVLRRASLGETFVSEHAEASGLISGIRSFDGAIETAAAGLIPAERITL